MIDRQKVLGDLEGNLQLARTSKALCLVIGECCDALNHGDAIDATRRLAKVAGIMADTIEILTAELLRSRAKGAA